MTNTVYARIKCTDNINPGKVVSIFSKGVWKVLDDSLGISYSRQDSGLENDIEAVASEVNTVVSILDMDFENGKAVGLTMRSELGAIFLSLVRRGKSIDMEFVLLCEIPEIDGRLDLNKVFDWVVSPFLMEKLFILDYVIGEDQPKVWLGA